ncbi:hypothetical protein GCM10022252_12120 [Streptosporangium oxazolinicum]|uniref:Amidohydrolase n=1 Tax=Streptosporangium oxazolinicum TaxID=909287 RepID=A0ABP8AHM6_9ACTN
MRTPQRLVRVAVRGAGHRHLSLGDRLDNADTSRSMVGPPHTVMVKGGTVTAVRAKGSVQAVSDPAGKATEA